MDNRELAVLLTETAALLNDEVEPLTEAAKFNFFPKFVKLKEKYPELAEADGILNEGNKIMGEMGEVPTEKQLKKFLKVVLKILKYWLSISTAVALPFLITILPIIPYTITRLEVYLAEYGYNALQKSEVKDQMEVMKKVIEKTTDKKQKERLQNHFDRLSEIYSKLS